MAASACSSVDEMEAMHDLSAFDVIGIDEGQFFEGLAAFCDQQASIGKARDRPCHACARTQERTHVRIHTCFEP
jgi:hypothetical protein